MTSSSVDIVCPKCGKNSKGVKLGRVISVDGVYDKIFSCCCHILIHRKADD